MVMEDFAASVKGKVAQWRLDGLQGLMFGRTELCGHEELKQGGKVSGCPAMEARQVFPKGVSSQVKGRQNGVRWIQWLCIVVL